LPLSGKSVKKNYTALDSRVEVLVFGVEDAVPNDAEQLGTVKIDREGLITLWARTETKTELPIDIRFGNEYYIRCSISMGAFVGRPRLEQVDNKTGKLEIQSISDKK
jgi:hypothetical protein